MTSAQGYGFLSFHAEMGFGFMGMDWGYSRDVHYAMNRIRENVGNWQQHTALELFPQLLVLNTSASLQFVFLLFNFDMNFLLVLKVLGRNVKY